MRYDPIADFAYHLGYSYGEAEEMLIKHEKKSNEKEVKKIVEVEERADTKDNKNVFKNWLLEEAGLDDEELTLYYKGEYEGKQYEGYIITGTRGWNLAPDNQDDKKIEERELMRLENSIKDGINKYGEKPIIVCMHYPPLLKDYKESDFTRLLEKYNNVKFCLYGHLHGKSHVNVLEGIRNNIDYRMVSCDYTNFQLIKIV